MGNDPFDETPADPFPGWIAASRAGSSDDFGKIIEACQDYLLLIANQDLDAELRSKLGASDLVQDTLLRAQKKFGDFRGETEQELLAWLRAILKNCMAGEGRRFHKADKRDVSRERQLDLRDSRGVSMEIEAGDNTPRRGAIADEEAAMLNAAMAELSEDYKQVLQLRNWERLSFVEIGERIGRSAEAARKLWSRAIEQVQHRLNQGTRDHD